MLFWFLIFSLETRETLCFELKDTYYENICLSIDDICWFSNKSITIKIDFKLRKISRKIRNLFSFRRKKFSSKKLILFGIESKQ